MELFEFENPYYSFHAVQGNKIYGSFRNKAEAESFIDSCNQNEMQKLSEEEEQKLLTLDQLKAGYIQEPNQSIGEFKFLGTDSIS